MNIFESIKEKNGVAQCYRNIGRIYYMQDNDAVALKYAYDALRLFEETRDSTAMASCLVSIGGSYYYQGNYPEARRYYTKGLEISKCLGDQVNMAFAKKNIGLLDCLSGNEDYALGKEDSATKKYAMAIEKIDGAITIYKQLKNQYGLLETYPLLGNVYEQLRAIALDHNNPMRAGMEFRHALELYSSLLKIAEKFNDNNYLSEAYNNLGSIYIKLKKYTEARKCLEKTLQLSAPANLRTTIKDSYFRLAVLDSCEHNFELALWHYKKFILYRDSSINEKSTRNIAGLRVQYEVEKKENEIKLLSIENKLKTASVSKESQRKNFAYLGIAAIVLAGGYGFNRYRKKKKLQNLQSVMNERLRISTELHDEVGATLSGIAMYSHLAKQQIKTDRPADIEKSLDIIQNSSGDMVNKLNDIVWLINPEQDSLQKLVERLEEYARNMAAIKNIGVSINMNVDLQEYKLAVEIKRSIYLFCKEAINNAVKYSDGDRLDLTINKSNAAMSFSVADNGKGFDHLLVKPGNGLVNMQKRADDIGANFVLQSQRGSGTSVSLQYKIT